MKKILCIVAIIILLLVAGAAWIQMGTLSSISASYTKFTSTSQDSATTSTADTSDIPTCASLPKKAPLTTTLSVAWSKPVAIGDLALNRKTACAVQYVDENGKLLSDNSFYDPVGTMTGSEYNDYIPDIGTITYYQVGKVQGGVYDGAQTVLAVRNDGQMDNINSHGMQVARLLIKNGKITLLSLNSDEFVFGLDPSKFSFDNHSLLPDLSFPQQFSNKGVTYSKDGNAPDFHFSVNDVARGKDKTGLIIAFTDPNLGTVYTDAAGNDGEYSKVDNDIVFSQVRSGFYIQAPDGTYRVYTENIPSWYDQDKNIADVTWSDGTKATAEYEATDWGGCGKSNYASVMKNFTSTDLVATGKTSNGDNVYELSDPNNILLKNLFSQYQKHLNVPENLGSTVMTYGQFVASHQVFFWYDPLGRIIKFETSDYRTSECGKPVIYLYPTATTTVLVQINPKGGMTKSDPTYNSGWNVLATPQSLLINISTGLQYPYLFWEGNGEEVYQTPTKGWIVPQKNIHTFLTAKLAQLGLNEKESDDFEEFWEPRMVGSSYYFITFEGTETMNEIAPLTITPKPDTVIRILMDYRPLEKPIPVQGFDIKTPVRKGFSVIEWGGVLR